MKTINITNGRLFFRWTNEFGTLFEFSVLETGEAGLFAQPVEGNPDDTDNPGQWEHITPMVFDNTPCEHGISIDDSILLARALNTIHVSLATGFMSTYKPVPDHTGDIA